MTSRRAAGSGGRGRAKKRKARPVQPALAGDGPPGEAAAATALSIVNVQLRRFPWPADPGQRYSLESPCLAIVNARGPWAVWRHGDANPPFIPLCLDLLDKPFWRRATNDQRVFALTVWMRAAQADDWGIIAWGDPARLCYEWGFDDGTFSDRLEWMIGAGLACYLTRAEAELARNWRPSRQGRNEGERGGEKPEGGGGEPGKEGEREQASQARQDKVKQDKPEPVQIPGPNARARQIPDSGGQGGKDKTSKQVKQGTGKSQQTQQATGQGQEPGNLPNSDHGAAREPSAATGHARGLPSRPPSVPRGKGRGGDVVKVGDLLGWQNPDAVSFGRRMYEAIHGRRPPADLMAAHDGDKGDVGVWVHYWMKRVRASIPKEKYSAFEDRCFADIGKKRRTRGVRNPGGLARKTIVPGVLSAMVKEGK